MKRLCLLLFSAAALMSGCGRKITAPSHGEATFTGSSFKAGKGVLLTDETRRLLGVEVADVEERSFPASHAFTLQVFGEKHHATGNSQDHSSCDAQGTGVIPSAAAAFVRTGQSIELRKGANQTFPGVVLSKMTSSSPGEAEVVIGIPNSAAIFQPGEFVSATFSSPAKDTATVVPQSALLHTVEGPFVYAVNGDAYFRTAVRTGGESQGWVEVLDGLLTGDQVVTKAVESLWLIELRATKGGDACTH